MTRISAGDNAYWHNLSEFVKYCMQEDAGQVTLRNKWVTLNIFIIITKRRKNKRQSLHEFRGKKDKYKETKRENYNNAKSNN